MVKGKHRPPPQQLHPSHPIAAPRSVCAAPTSTDSHSPLLGVTKYTQTHTWMHLDDMMEPSLPNSELYTAGGRHPLPSCHDAITMLNTIMPG